MTTNTFYASTPVSGIPLGGSLTLGTDAVIALYNSINSTTQVVIKSLYWTFLSGTMGNCNLIWVQTLQPTKITGQMVKPISVSNVATSVSDVRSGASVFRSIPTIIRPSDISFVNTIVNTIEILNGNELTLSPGWSIGVTAIGSAGVNDKSIITLVWQET